MSDPITFTIPGKPFAKQRPRFSRKNGRAFTPKETVNFETLVSAIALRHFAEPLEGPVKVTIWAEFEPPPSWPKAKREAALRGVWHTQKPDGDNVEKAILDGLNRIAFRDDSQVAECARAKVWSERSATVITVRALTDA